MPEIFKISVFMRESYFQVITSRYLSILPTSVSARRTCGGGCFDVTMVAWNHGNTKMRARVFTAVAISPVAVSVPGFKRCGENGNSNMQCAKVAGPKSGRANALPAPLSAPAL